MMKKDSARSAGRKPFRSLWFIAVLAWPTEAQAHGTISIGDFYTGLIHPMSHPEQVLAVVAAGLLVGQMAAGLAWPTARSFIASVLAGSILGLMNLGLPGSSVVVTLSLIVLGAFVALRAELPGKLTVGVYLFLGLAVGYTTSSQMSGNLKMPVFYLGGTLVGVGWVLLYSAQLVRRFRASWFQLGVRVIGSWIAAAGILIFAFQARSAL
jgi:hydrogenase/urease accessory protein HupE